MGTLTAMPRLKGTGLLMPTNSFWQQIKLCWSGASASSANPVPWAARAGTEVKYNGEDYLLLSARDVLAIVEK